MAPLRCAAKFDPFLSLDCVPHPLPWRNPRKGRDQILPSHLAILELISFMSASFPVLLLHPGHQLCAAVRVHRLQPVQPGVDHVPAVGDHVQDHPQVPGPLRAGRGRQEAAGGHQVRTMRLIDSLHLFCC